MYLYHCICCGTGSTKVTLDFFKEKFILKYHCRWMGQDEIKYTIQGTYTKNGNYYFLSTEEGINFELFTLSEKQKLNKDDALFENFLNLANCAILNNKELEFNFILKSNVTSEKKWKLELEGEDKISLVNYTMYSIKMLSRTTDFGGE